MSEMIRRTEDLIVRELADETLIYDRRRHKAHCLGPLLALVWRACDGRRTAEQLSAHLSAEEPSITVAVVRVALDRLHRAGLLEGAPPRMPGPARREALRSIAVLGGLALASITAPTPLQAASCTPSSICINLPNGQCSGLPCCEMPTRRCTKPSNLNKCSCN